MSAASGAPRASAEETGPAPAAALDPPRVPAAAPPAPEAPGPDASRVRRFLGALLGGAVGFAAPLALSPAFSCPSFGGVVVSCFPAAHALLAIASPLLGLTGSVLGYVAAGGRASLAGVGAFFPAVLAMLGVMAAMAPYDSGLGSWVPAVVVGGAVLATTSAALLVTREEDVAARTDEAGRFAGADRVRVAATVVTATGLALVGVLTAFLVTNATRSGAVLPIAVGGAFGVLQVFSAWGVHRALGGQAPPWAPLVALVAEAATAAFMVTAGLLPSTTTTGFAEATRNGLALVGATTGVVLGLAAIPLLLFEGLHTRATAKDEDDLRFGLAPLPGGAVVSAGLRW